MSFGPGPMNEGEFAAAWSLSPDGSKLRSSSRADRAWRKIPIALVWGALIAINWAADGDGFHAISRLSATVTCCTSRSPVNPLLGEGQSPRRTG